MSIAQRITEINKKHGLELYLYLLENSDLPFIREEIIQKMRQLANQNFSYDSEKSADENNTALKKWKNWIGKM